MKILRFTFLQFLLIFAILSACAQNSGDKIVGNYYAKLSRNEAKVKAFKYQDGYRLQIYWLKNNINEDGSKKMDKNNPDKGKRSTLLENAVLVEKVIYKDGIWQGGKIYDPSSGRTYKVELKLKNNKELEVKGILGIFHKCMYWERIK